MEPGGEHPIAALSLSVLPVRMVLPSGLNATAWTSA